jgi:hypothetical protein
MNKRASRGGVYLIFVTAQRMQVPSRHKVGMILIRTQHDGIATATQAEMDMGLALCLAQQKPNNELTTGALELSKAPLPR